VLELLLRNIQDYTDIFCHYYLTNHKIYIPKV